MYRRKWGFPSGPVVRILPSNARCKASIPGQGIKIPHTGEQLLSPCATTREKSMCLN